MNLALKGIYIIAESLIQSFSRHVKINPLYTAFCRNSGSIGGRGQGTAGKNIGGFLVKGRKKAKEQEYKHCKLCPDDSPGMPAEKTGNMRKEMRERLHANVPLWNKVLRTAYEAGWENMMAGKRRPN